MAAPSYAQQRRELAVKMGRGGDPGRPTYRARERVLAGRSPHRLPAWSSDSAGAARRIAGLEVLRPSPFRRFVLKDLLELLETAISTEQVGEMWGADLTSTLPGEGQASNFVTGDLYSTE